ncbi:MAG: T9SS type A sorting domain-containing protein [Bacteroidota bacterium]|nr:T9SS type A sorting domain-containing protein [Bacteroidota bacterium]
MTIQTIAHQCPYSGGKAVYQARAIISKYYSDTIIYDDKNVCLAEGIYRQSVSNSTITKPERNFIIVPNPAKDYFEVHILKTFEGNCKMEVFDSMNRLHKKENLNCTSKIHRFDSIHLKPGVYTIRLTSNQKTNYTAKLVIVK